MTPEENEVRREQWRAKVLGLATRPKTWADVMSQIEVMQYALTVLKSAVAEADAVFGHENELLEKE